MRSPWRVLLGGLLVGGLLAVAVPTPLVAQGPFAAQIQAALRAFVAQPNTWTGAQTFTNVVVNGTCTGCGGGGGTPGGSDTQVQFNDSGAFGGDSGLTWNKTTNALRLNVQPLVTGVADDANDGEPALVIYPASGSEVSLLIAGAFTDGNTWSGLWADAFSNGQVFLGSMINGSASTTTMTIVAGSGGLSLGTSGPLSLLGSAIAISDGVGVGPDTITGHTALFQAYDVDGTAYKTFATLTNGNTPDFTLAAPSGGTVNIDATLIAADKFDDIFMGNSAVIGPISTTATAFYTLSAYDNDDAQYRTFCTATNGNTPTFDCSAPAGGTMTLQPTTYKSADGTTGVTVAVCTSFKDGLCVAGT